jgi:uncharacterized protein
VTQAALSLWTGQTVHARYTPFANRFAYKLVLIDIDIGRLADAAKVSRFFSINRPGLFSFHERDHGAHGALDLRSWAESQFAKAGVVLSGGAIRLVTFPRHLFYKFAPISLWYGYDAGGALKGIIYEVRNTFGENHNYVAAVTGDRSQHEAGKAFHVSPFFDVTGQYRFTLRAPRETLDVVVESLADGERLHMANIKARATPATSAALLRCALVNPLSTLGVTVAIHWQALKLWMRGARYRRKPEPPPGAATVALTLPHPLPSKDAA